jgi:hypothetical protein
MTFISDSSSLRTWDPDRGIELKFDKAMSDGTMFMRLLNAGATLHFTMQTTHEPPVGGSEKPLIVRRVRYPQRPLADFSIEETANVIRESLASFKGVHGLHPDEHVRVDFVMPPTDDEIIEKMTATVAQCRRLAKERPDSAQFFREWEERTETELKQFKAKRGMD